MLYEVLGTERAAVRRLQLPWMRCCVRAGRATLRLAPHAGGGWSGWQPLNRVDGCSCFGGRQIAASSAAGDPQMVREMLGSRQHHLELAVIASVSSRERAHVDPGGVMTSMRTWCRRVQWLLMTNVPPASFAIAQYELLAPEATAPVSLSALAWLISGRRHALVPALAASGQNRLPTL